MTRYANQNKGAPYNGGMGTDYLDYRAVAAYLHERHGLDVGVPSLRVFLARARANRRAGAPTDSDMPEPDVMFGRTPAWKPRTIDRWIKRRPGSGVGGAEARRTNRNQWTGPAA